ncbi:telomerase Cajal body protein 1-like [Convolutriloba macropyga]|uniref:telomerase Cajal body protein 1-like n=1 Tax=Convolutriloba macropyga TaxID=536237 RepID=UPI003F528917
MTCKAELLAISQNQFKTPLDNYLRGLKFSPNGQQFISNSNDNLIRIFNSINELQNGDVLPELCLNIGQPVYDFTWHPRSESFVTSSRRSSVHLWSSDNGSNLCSYPIRNHVDEITSPFSLQFDLEGQHLFCGFDKCIRIININRPNDVPVIRSLKNQQAVFTQSGIISSIAINQSMYCLSTYAGIIGLFDLKSGVPVGTLVNGHDSTGITCVKFSTDEKYLISGARKETKLCIWDLRQISVPLFQTLPRNANSNQKIDFDVCKSFVFSGSLDGDILVYDLRDFNSQPCNMKAHVDSCNSLSCSPQLTGNVVSGSGQRHYLKRVMSCAGSRSSSDESDSEQSPIENSIKFWKFAL